MAKKRRTSRRPAAPKSTTRKSPKARRSRGTDGDARPKPLAAAKEPSPYDLEDADVERALLARDGLHQRQLEELFGEGALAHMRALAAQGQRSVTRGGPDVLVLPGIMGSTLGFEGPLFNDTIWVDPIDLGLGNLVLLAPQRKKKVKALGVLLTTYLELKLKLRLKGIDASFHPYDWRLDIRTLGEELAARIEANHSREGVHLVCHSMGGLVARRAMHVLKAKGKDKWVKQVVMLGTPNHGAFAPVLVLRQCHALTQKLAKLDQRHSFDELVDEVFSRLVGLMQLLPPVERNLEVDLLDPKAWPAGRAPHADAAKAARHLPKDLDAGDQRYTLIAGFDRPTYIGARIEGDEFVFRQSNEGDGTVPLAHAELAAIGRTYYTRAEHGGMPSSNEVIESVADIIRIGRTERLPTRLPEFDRRAKEFRESALRTRSAPSRGKGAAPAPPPAPSEVRDLLAGFASPTTTPSAGATPPADSRALAAWQALSDEPIEVSRKRQRALDLRIALGDITQVDARAIVLGMFEGVEPTGAAKAIDVHLDGVIRELIENGLLNGSMGQIFVLPTSRQSLRAEFLMFVGLGRLEDFDDARLRTVSRSTALAIARAKLDDFATVLLGSGTGGDPGTSLANMVSGFLEALRVSDGAEHVRRVTIVENDRERFCLAVENLRLMATSIVFDEVRVTLSRHELPPPPQARIESRGTEVLQDPVYLSVRQEVEVRAGKRIDVAHMTLLTADKGATVLVDAREVDFKTLEGHLIQLEQGDAEEALGDLGDWIAKDLLTPKLHEGLQGSLAKHLVVMHDDTTSRIPWEALRLETADGARFPALEKGLSRKLLTGNQSAAQWLTTREVGEVMRVLLVVDPTGDLAGAREEGKALAEVLGKTAGIEVTVVKGPEATRARIRSELASGSYDVLHYAGHAQFDQDDRSRSGLLCSDGLTFAGAQLSGIESLPALAVVNACESGRVRKKTAASPREKASDKERVKVSLAEAFLTGGIASYVGTYWPVGDAAAASFAEAFYGQLLAGKPIADALIAGRNAVKDVGSIDWADYVHYGTRTLRLRKGG